MVIGEPFCGIGILAILVVPRFRRVIAVEILVPLFSAHPCFSARPGAVIVLVGVVLAFKPFVLPDDGG
jgi:hypothetical protein